MDVQAKQNRSQDLRERPQKANSPAAEPSNIAMTDSDQSVYGDGLPGANSLRLKECLFAAALVAAVFLAYMPCWHGGFVFDDDLHLLNNPVLQPGGIAKAWVPGGYLSYWPLTFTAYWLQYQFWGPDTLGYHLVNLALHALSALLVWRVLVRLRVPGAMFAAAIFALHPVNVETAAWIAQLRGVLSLVLTLVSVLFYLGNEQRPNVWRYLLAIAAFALSTLAKGAAITLPAVLLACAWWQRGRIGRRDLLRVLPYLLIGAVMSGVEIWAQHYVAQGDVVRSDGFFSRAAVAGCALWFYLGKLILPINLCPFYSRWTIDARSVLSYLPGLAWLGLLACAWWQRRTSGRPVVMLIVCYSALLLPVLGFVNIYFMRYSLVADHWQYIATIVPCAVFAGLLATLGRRFLGTLPTYLMELAILAVLAVLSLNQSRMFAGPETFYETTIARNSDCWVAHNNLGEILARHRQFDSAITHYQRAIELNPDYSEAQNNLGDALLASGRIDLAIVHYRKALEINPRDAEVHYNLAVALAAQGSTRSAIAEYQNALALFPGYGKAHNNLAAILLSQGDRDSAILHFERALEEIKPENARIHNNLALALAGNGQIDAAIAHYQRALQIDPNYADARANLAAALSRCGGGGAVNAGDHKTRQAAPNDAEAHCSVATNLARKGDVSAAITEYLKSLAINPDYALAHNNLGVVLVSSGQAASGIAHLRRAIDIQPDYAEAHFNLANALAPHGEFDAAIAEYEKALAIKPDYAAAQTNLAAVRSAREKVLKAKPGQ